MKKINYNLNLIVFTLIPLMTNQATFEKTIYLTKPKFINSVTCVSVSFYFGFQDGIEDYGELSVRLNELNEDGHETKWITEIDHIPLRPEDASISINHSKTVQLDHREMFIVSIVHKMPRDNQQTIDVTAKVFLEDNPCESPIDYQVSLTPRIDLPSTNESQSTHDIQLTVTPSTQSALVTTMETLITINQQSTMTPTTYSTNPIVTKANDSPSIKPTIISTTINSIDVTIPSTEEPFTSGNSTQLITTIKDLTDNSSQSGANQIETSNESNQSDLKTGNLVGDLSSTIKLLSNKRYSIPSIAGLVGLIVMTISLTMFISRHKRQDYLLKNRSSIVSKGISLNTIKVHKQSTNL